jgi:hypothetical protein
LRINRLKLTTLTCGYKDALYESPFAPDFGSGVDDDWLGYRPATPGSETLQSSSVCDAEAARVQTG